MKIVAPLLLLFIRISLSSSFSSSSSSPPPPPLKYPHSPHHHFIKNKLKEHTTQCSSTKLFKGMAVSTEHHKCSEAGAYIGESGGNAVDAAIASLLCIGVVNNFSSGIGGGGFMLIRAANGTTEMIDFREQAPLGSFDRMFDSNYSKAVNGTMAAAVPGEIAGMAKAHERWGRLPWGVLFDKSILLAKHGFQASAKMETMIEKFKDSIRMDPGMRETYLRADGITPKKRGDWIQRTNLATTLYTIALEGPSAFYSGTIGQSLVRLIKKRGNGHGFTMKDLLGYRVKIRETISVSLGKLRLITGGSPTSGAILAQIMQVLFLESGEQNGVGIDNDNNDVKTAQPAQQPQPTLNGTLPIDEMHRMIETFKHSYGERLKMGDPEYVDGMAEIVKAIVSKERVNVIRCAFDAKRTFSIEHYMPKEHFNSSPAPGHGTSHVTVMDRDGLVVSATSTVNLEWGCRVMDPITGIILNSQMDDFSLPGKSNAFNLPPTSANFIAEGKRPLSSACPVIVEDVEDGEVVLAAGGAGGSRIISAVAQTLMGILFKGRSPSEAIEGCRLHHQLIPNIVLAERRCPVGLLEGLSELGHKIQVMPPNQHPTSVNVVIRNKNKEMMAVSDRRKGGIGAGF